MVVVNVEIERARRQVTVMEHEGRVPDRDIAEAYLRGLLTAAAIYEGSTIEPGCAHVVHTPAGFDNAGRTVWRCADCGEVT
jgi:hypothetical protein